jgi:PAS domain S-box-containing protein
MTQHPHSHAIAQWLNNLATYGVFTTDSALVVTSWNRWLERVTGCTASNVVGRDLSTAIPAFSERGLDRYYRAALVGEASVLSHRFHGHLLRVITASGDMPQSARIEPLIDDAGVIGTITVIEDVSERVNSESELRRQIAAAETARANAEDALRVKDEFLATLSHELRTPLNAVLGWTNILLGHNVDSAMLDRALRVIDRNAVAQARLIDDMLDMARIVSGKLRLDMGKIDLAAATLAAIDVVTPTAQAKQVTIRRALGTGPQIITADDDRVQQIAWNVLSNAVKFTPNGGTIDVSIEPRGTDVALIISDSGKGIAKEFLPHVFERFRQANSSISRTEGGLGLGLALVRQLVEMHGGQILAESDGVGRGSRFTIIFPTIAERRDSERVRVRAASESSTLTGHRVLVVEDDDDWRELLETALRNHGGDVVAVAGAREALAIVTGPQERRPDVIVADIGLPEQDGYVLMRTIRDLGGGPSRIAAVAVTAYAGPGNERLALNAGFDAYRAKPVSPEAVVATIADVLAARQTKRWPPARSARAAPREEPV